MARVKIEIIEITPEMARQFLEGTVAKLDRNGRLVDGRRRLKACIRSDVATSR